MLGANRDGHSSADTSRGLLITILGEFVLPAGGAAWTQTLTSALELVGVKDKAARQAISRLHARGWLDRTRAGRQTRWSLTDQAAELLRSGAERIYGFGAGSRTWDGTWVVLLASVPERDRSVRYRMGVELRWAGFGSLGNGVWLSPWADQEDQAVTVLERLGVDATSFRGELGQLGTGADLARSAWDLVDLRAEYDAFIAETDHQDAGPLGGRRAAADLTELVHRWRRFPFLDPELPTELLPADWPGPAAAERFAGRRSALVGPATDWWTEIGSSFAPPIERTA